MSEKMDGKKVMVMGGKSPFERAIPVNVRKSPEIDPAFKEKGEPWIENIKIEKGIKIPVEHTVQIPVRSMELGDSFHLSWNHVQVMEGRNAIMQLLGQYGFANGTDYVTAFDDLGLRVWRIK